jgi:uncharacterized membrane protein
MGSLFEPITRFFQTVNYVYIVQVIVILSIIALLLFIFYSLGLIKLPENK